MSGRNHVAAALGHSGNVLLTGYWPPTNEMLRHFSNEPSSNPGRWEGENWRGLGFDVFAYFAEFDTNPPTNPGSGPFRVHYDDTSRDWQRITRELEPVGIITFSLGASDMYHVWELEDRATNHTSWYNLFGSGLPSVNPPDQSVPAGTVRYSTLPMQEIIAAVMGLDLAPSTMLYALVDDQGGGRFLSEYISYHGLWYQAEHERCPGGRRCLAAGHVHVGPGIDVETARLAMEATLEATLLHLRRRIYDRLSVARIARSCLQ